MKNSYADWLHKQGYNPGTVGTQLARVERVEEHYGDLDVGYQHDRLSSLIETLAYSTEDERRSRPNPTTIPIVGVIRTNLASYKSSVLWYRRFRDNEEAGSDAQPVLTATAESPPLRRPAVVRSTFEPRSGAKTLADFGMDGRAALEALIAGSQYKTLAQAVASLAIFSHPQTVRQTEGKALFPSIRDPKRVGQFDIIEGRRVLLDDNKSATDAFLWANGLSRRGPDTQFNHVYSASADPDAYTALPNLCMTPAFIAKLTDTNREIGALLRYRSFALYQWVPRGFDPPQRPDEYESLEWAAPLPQVDDVRSTVLAAMATKAKDRTVLATIELGWLFK